MTTYLPTLLLLSITYATTFFKAEYFEASVTVNLTIMLVMTTIFTSKIEELPPTSDTKMIDIWLIFCLLVPFAFTLIQTAIECYREEKIESKRPEAWSGGPVREGSVVCVVFPKLKITRHANIAGGHCSCKTRCRDNMAAAATAGGGQGLGFKASCDF